MNWNWFNWFASTAPQAQAVVAVVEAEAPARIVSVFDVVLGALKARSAGHPILIAAESWIQDEVDAYGAALIAEAEFAVIVLLAPRLAAMGIVIPPTLPFPLPAVRPVAAAPRV